MIVSFISKTKFIFRSTFLSQVNVDLLERHHYYHPQTWSCLSERSTLAKSIRSSSEMPSSGLDDSRSPPLHCPRTLTQLIERSTPTTTLKQFSGTIFKIRCFSQLTTSSFPNYNPGVKTFYSVNVCSMQCSGANSDFICIRCVQFMKL